MIASAACSGSTEAELTIRDAIRGDAAVAVGRVRTWIANNLPHATLAQCARSLCVSERALQRTLQDSGTSLRKELTHARVARAQQLLQTTDEKLESIAKEVGLSTSEHLVKLFRRLMGTSPNEWRTQTRAK